MAVCPVSSKKAAHYCAIDHGSEYIAVAHATKRPVIHTFIAEIAWPLRHPTVLHWDIQSANLSHEDDQTHSPPRISTSDIISFVMYSKPSGYPSSIAPWISDVTDLFTKSLAALCLESSCYANGTVDGLRGSVDKYGIR